MPNPTQADVSPDKNHTGGTTGRASAQPARDKGGRTQLLERGGRR